MIPFQHGAIVVAPMTGATQATNATHTLVFDKSGFDYATILAIIGTHATTAGDDVSVCALREHSSVTSYTSMTAIVPATGGTATSTSVGYVIPGPSLTGDGCVIRFNVDLRKREKIIGLGITNGSKAADYCGIAILSREKESADTAAKMSLASALVYSNTSITAVAKVVNL